METVLVLLHGEADGTLSKAALEAVGAAASLGAPFTVGLIGSNLTPAANSMGTCGASRFLGVEGEEFGAPRYGSDAADGEALCREAGAALVVVPGTSRFHRVLAGVAHRLDGAVDTHIAALGVEGAITVTRWYYRQRIEATLTRSRRPWFLSLEPGAFAPWTGAPAEAPIDRVAVTLPEAARRTTVAGTVSPSSGRETIRPDAKLLLVAGAGWTKKQADGQTHVPEAEKIIWEFLKCTRASLGSSKSLVDLGGEGQAVLPFLSHLNQIGQTGSTPRHPKGLSTCCHGEEPHTVGWRFINERRAISLDPNCGWARGKADVLYVADAFKVMAKVNELLAVG